MRAYTTGSAWWQGDCGPYWGHNALIRDEEQIFAQIDIDSHQFDAFCDETVRDVEKLAARLADAYARRPSRAV